MTSSIAPAVAPQWTPVQRSFRKLLVALREAYYHDRSKLFWARHRVRVEVYKYAAVEDSAAVHHLVAVGDQVAAFVAEHLQFSVDRVVDHNETMMRLPVAEAKRFRARFLEKETEHEVWCKQRIKALLAQRPPPPFPFC